MNTIEDFWWIVELTRIRSDGTDEGQAEYLREILVTLTKEEIAIFSGIWSALFESMASNRLESAYTLMAGGFSNDSYDYFRDWILSLGQVCYERIRLKPDLLADLGELKVGQISFEKISSAQSDALERIVGPDSLLDALDLCDFDAIRQQVRKQLPPLPQELTTEWESFAEAAEHCPRLAKLYDRS